MFRQIKRFESSCHFCDGKTKVETDQGIAACTTFGAEDPDFIPFFEDPEDAKLREKRAKKVKKVKKVNEANEIIPEQSEPEDWKAKVLELYNIRRANVARRLEQDRWERKIREEEARRAQCERERGDAKLTENREEDSDREENSDREEDSEPEEDSDFSEEE